MSAAKHRFEQNRYELRLSPGKDLDGTIFFRASAWHTAGFWLRGNSVSPRDPAVAQELFTLCESIVRQALSPIVSRHGGWGARSSHAGSTRTGRATA